MDNSNLVEVTMEAVDTVIFKAISEIRGKSKPPDEARIYNFVKDFIDDSGVSDGFIRESMKTLEDQGVIINRPTKCASSFFLLKSLHEPTDNSNTINTTPTISLPSNTCMCRNYDTDISLLSEGIDSLEQLFDRQHERLTQMSLVKFNSKVTNTKSDILILSLQGTICILKKELINEENTIKNLSIILKSIRCNTHKVSPSNKESNNEPILENNTDHIDSENKIVHELLDVELEHLQRRYQHLLDQSPNQPEQTSSKNQCSNKSDVTKEYKVIESNLQTPELNKVTPLLNKFHHVKNK